MPTLPREIRPSEPRRTEVNAREAVASQPPRAAPSAVDSDDKLMDDFVVVGMPTPGELEGKSPQEQSEIVSRWSDADLARLSQSELLGLKAATERAAAASEGRPLLQRLSNLFRGDPALSMRQVSQRLGRMIEQRSTLEHVHAQLEVSGGHERQAQKLVNGADLKDELTHQLHERLKVLDQALRALGGVDELGRAGALPLPQGQEREGHLQMAKALLSTIQRAPQKLAIPEFLRSHETSPLHLAYQAGDPELAELATRVLPEDLLYTPDAKGLTPTSYLSPTEANSGAFVALKERGFDPSKLDAQNQAEFQDRRKLAVESVARRFLSENPAYATLDRALRALADAQASGEDEGPHLLMAKAALKKLNADGTPLFWGYLDSNPRTIAERANDPELQALVTQVFGNAWKDSN